MKSNSMEPKGAMSIGHGQHPASKGLVRPFDLRRRRGFTLTELMVVIVIIVILAAISFSGYKRIKSNASAAVDLNDMRTIYTSLNLYVGDNNGFLPVSYSGVGPVYNPKGRSLTTALAPYLGVENPQPGYYFSEMASENFQDERNGEGGPSLLIMQRVYTGKGRVKNVSRPSPNITPFGYPNPYRAPMRWSAAVARMGSPSQRLMITENDKAHPNYVGSTPGWFDGLADGMAHGTYRLGLFWDGHVDRLNQDLTVK